ncbi:MAG TPA: DUF29 family protein [Acetobacteraceae bacterium]
MRPGSSSSGVSAPMSDLYDTDMLAWSERQADLLRRMAAGERVNDQVDWGNVAEEISDMGNNLVRAVASHLVQAMPDDDTDGAGKPDKI